MFTIGKHILILYYVPLIFIKMKSVKKIHISRQVSTYVEFNIFY